MTIVNTTTGEITEAMDEGSAKRLTERIRLLAENIADQVDKLAGLIDEARVGSAWLALGYRSWSAYVASEFRGVLPRLERDPRQEFVRELSARGMSTRAIAPVVGVSKDTVHRDLAAVSSETPDLAEERFVERASEVSQDAFDAAVEAARTEGDLSRRNIVRHLPTAGLDGKTYTPTAPRPRPVVNEDEWSEQDRAEELAGNLARNLSLLYAVTNPERRAEYIATWRRGTANRPVLGQNFITPTHMRSLADALRAFADEWESADV